jgi:tetratricopeptide (TPR) repeat protein
MRSGRIFGIVAVAAASSFAWTVAADEVERRVGGKTERVRGKVTDENNRKVVVQADDGDVTIPPHEIVGVRYDRQPAELITIKGQMDAERYEEAAASLASLYTNVREQDNDFLKAAVLFQLFKARAMLARQDPEQMAAAFETAADFEKTFPKSRHAMPFNELLGDLYLTKGDFAGAQKAFAALRDSAAPGAKEKAAVYEGLALLEAGKTADALLNFDDVIRSAEESAKDSKLAAQVFKAEALLRGTPDPTKIANAEKLIRQTLTELPDDARLVKAMARNALGDALRLSKKPPKEALLDGYMWVHVYYKEDPRQWARATYHAANIFNAIGKKFEGERLAEALRTQAPNSEWTRKLPPAPAGG